MLMAVVIGAFVAWWILTTSQGPKWWIVVIFVAGMATGTFVGLVISRRNWWLALIPLPAFSLYGYLLSFRFSHTRPLDTGDYTAAATVLLVGISAGVLGTVALLLTLALRALVSRIVRSRSRVA